MNKRTEDEGFEQRIKQAEENEAESNQLKRALLESERNFKAFLNAIPESAILVEPDGKVLDTNGTTAMRLGIQSEDMIGMNIFNHMPSELHKSRSLYGNKVLESGQPVYFEDERQGKIFSNRVYPIFDSQKKVVRFAVLAFEITKHKQLEESLKENREQFRLLSESSPIGIFKMDNEGRVIYLNNKGLEIIGIPIADALGFSWTKFLHSEDRPCVFEEWEKCLEKKIGYNGEFRFRRPSGEVRWTHTQTSVALSPSGQVVYHVGTIEDITARKLAHLALIKNERELQIKNKDLEQLNTALKILLKKREEDKIEIEDNILANVKTLITPYIAKLKQSNLDQNYKTLLSVLESNLDEIISPFTRKLSSKYLYLTPSEIQVANLVKQGKTNKEIAKVLKVTDRAIAFHRGNIRKKLGLTNKKTNLRTYLYSFD